MEQVHRNVRNHVCQLCGKAFPSQHGLDRHLENPHINHCQFCEMRFNSKPKLTLHVTERHPEMVAGKENGGGGGGDDDEDNSEDDVKLKVEPSGS